VEGTPYFTNHDRRARFPWSLYHRPLERCLARALGSRRDGDPRVLVVGCGLEPFVPGIDHAIYYGADLDARSIATCRERFPELSERLGVCPSPYELPHEAAFDGGFDAIVAKEVVEHLGQPDRWVGALAGRLAPGGELLLTTPNYGRLSTLALLESTVLEGLARRDGYSRKDIHPSRFNRRTFRSLGVSAGLELVEVRVTWTGWALFGRWRKSSQSAWAGQVHQ
jgi:SAM-dependent methyltransferase